MKKIIGIILFILIILLIIYALYNLYKILQTKQNYENTRFSIKNYINKLKSQSNIKQKSEGPIPVLENPFENLKTVNSLRSLQSSETTKSPPKVEVPIDDITKIRLLQSRMGCGFYLPNLVLTEPSNFTKLGYNFFKDYIPEGPMSNGQKTIVKTRSFDNQKIQNNSQGSSLLGNFTFCNDTESIISSVSTQIDASIGAQYNAVSVNATASRLVQEDIKYNSSYQGYNVKVFKKNNDIFMEPDMLINEDYFSEYILDRILKLGNQDSIIEIKDKDTQQKDNYYTSNENLNTHNMHVDDTSWSKYNDFLRQFGSHIIISISYGKQLNLWETIQNSEREQTNLLQDKACISASYAGYQECRQWEECSEKYEYIKENMTTIYPSKREKAIEYMLQIFNGGTQILKDGQKIKHDKLSPEEYQLYYTKIKNYVNKYISEEPIECDDDSGNCIFNSNEQIVMQSFDPKNQNPTPAPTPKCSVECTCAPGTQNCTPKPCTPEPCNLPPLKYTTSPPLTTFNATQEIPPYTEGPRPTTQQPGGGGGGGGGGSGGEKCSKKDDCPDQKYCAGYTAPRPADLSNPSKPIYPIVEVLGQCKSKDGKNVGFSAGGHACKTRTEYNYDKITKLKCVRNVFISGGDDETEANIFVDVAGDAAEAKMTVIKEENLIKFLTSDPEKDVPIEFTFKPIWEIISNIYRSRCTRNEHAPEGSDTKICKLLPGCCIEIIDDKFRNTLIEDYEKDIFGEYKNFPTEILCASTDFIIDNFTKDNINFIVTPNTFQIQNIDKKLVFDGTTFDGYVFKVNELLPKIIYNEFATLINYEKCLLPGYDLYILITKDGKFADITMYANIEQTKGDIISLNINADINKSKIEIDDYNNKQYINIYLTYDVTKPDLLPNQTRSGVQYIFKSVLEYIPPQKNPYTGKLINPFIRYEPICLEDRIKKDRINFLNKTIEESNIEIQDLEKIENKDKFQNNHLQEIYKNLELLKNDLSELNKKNISIKRSSVDFNFARKIDRSKYQVDDGTGFGPIYYNYYYFDEIRQKNIVEIFVPQEAVKKYYDPCKMIQACYNIQAAYISQTLCQTKEADSRIIQKMIKKPVTDPDLVSHGINAYACWNRATGCQSTTDAGGISYDNNYCGKWNFCSNDPTDNCEENVKEWACPDNDFFGHKTHKNAFNYCDQLGLFYEPSYDYLINTGQTGDPIYRTVKYPSSIPTKGSELAKSGIGETSNKDIAQWSVASDISRLDVQGRTITTGRDPKWEYNNASPCRCQNIFTIDDKAWVRQDNGTYLNEITKQISNELPDDNDSGWYNTGNGYWYNNTTNEISWGNNRPKLKEKSHWVKFNQNILPYRLIWDQQINR